MDLKLVKIASVREHMDAHYRGDISYTKAVDLINEDANKQLMLGAVVKSFTAEQLGDMLANKFTTIEEAIHYFDTIE